MAELLWLILIGITIGWIAGLVIRGRGFGLVGNLVIGVLGSVVGGMLFALLGVHAYGLAGTLIVGVLGAVILLSLVGWARRGTAA